MNHRQTTILLITLLIFVSLTAAADEDLFHSSDDSFDLDDIGYDFPGVGPIAATLFDTAVGYVNNHIIPNLPHQIGRSYELRSGPTEPQPHPLPPPTAQAPRPYPTRGGCVSRITRASQGPQRRPRLRNLQPDAHAESSTQAWVNNTYTPGDRLRRGNAITGPQQPYQNNPLSSGHGPRHLLTCGHAGCTYTAERQGQLRQHQRCHIPPNQRPHPCPFCNRRFNYPREVRRHLPTHGLGTRYFCPHRGCQYAAQGFGRRDHLDRHVARIHEGQ